MVGCSCVVVKDHGKESQAKDVIEEYVSVRNEQIKNLFLVLQKKKNTHQF